MPKFDPKTMALMAEAFREKRCNKCNQQAKRFYCRLFWCHDCWERAFIRRYKPVEVQRARDYIGRF
jgi:hypothetical protein